MTASGTSERSRRRSEERRVSGRLRRFRPETSPIRTMTSLAPLILLLILGTVASAGHRVCPSPSQQKEDSKVEPGRTQYRIDLALDFDNRTYKGSERVSWTNHGEHAVSSIFFHLYANARAEPQPPTRSIPTISPRTSRELRYPRLDRRPPMRPCLFCWMIRPRLCESTCANQWRRKRQPRSTSNSKARYQKSMRMKPVW